MIKSMKALLKPTKLKDKIRLFITLAICVSFAFFSFATTYIYKDLFRKNTKQLILENFNLIYRNFEVMIDNAKAACALIENDEKMYDLIAKETDFLHGGNADDLYKDYATYIDMRTTIALSADAYGIDGITVYTNSNYVYGDIGRTYFDFGQIEQSTWYRYLKQHNTVSMFCNHEYFSDAEQTSEGDIYYIKLVRSHTSGRYIGAIRITISGERLKQLLLSNSSDLNNTTFLQNDVGEVVTPFDDSRTIEIDTEQASKQTLSYDGGSAIISQRIAGTNLYLISITSYHDAMAGFNRIKLLIYAITLIIILISYKLSKIFAIGITKRLNEMMDSMANVKNGVFQPVPPSNVDDDIEFCISNYNDMLLEFQTLLSTQKEHEAQKRKLQLKILQEQIKPHFLYNTLELINNSAIINNVPEISEIVLELSSFYRLSLNEGSEMHTLQDELQHIRLYFALQNKRAQKPLSLDINAPKELFDIELPKLLLQPIIENSFYHAFPVPINKKDARIEVTVKRVGNDIVIEVYDNGIGIPYDKQKSILEAEGESGGFGLNNIHERIRLFYGNGYGVTIASTPNVETRVQIKLPYHPA